jgi:hypothetical protein
MREDLRTRHSREVLTDGRIDEIAIRRSMRELPALPAVQEEYASSARRQIVHDSALESLARQMKETLDRGLAQDASPEWLKPLGY